MSRPQRRMSEDTEQRTSLRRRGVHRSNLCAALIPRGDTAFASTPLKAARQSPGGPKAARFSFYRGCLRPLKSLCDAVFTWPHPTAALQRCQLNDARYSLARRVARWAWPRGEVHLASTSEFYGDRSNTPDRKLLGQRDPRGRRCYYDRSVFFAEASRTITTASSARCSNRQDLHTTGLEWGSIRQCHPRFHLGRAARRPSRSRATARKRGVFSSAIPLPRCWPGLSAKALREPSHWQPDEMSVRQLHERSPTCGRPGRASYMPPPLMILNAVVRHHEDSVRACWTQR